MVRFVISSEAGYSDIRAGAAIINKTIRRAISPRLNYIYFLFKKKKRKLADSSYKKKN